MNEKEIVLSAEEYSNYLMLKNDYAEVKEQCAKLQADNERLYNNLAKFKKSVETETAKEFADKIKKYIHSCENISTSADEDICERIDEILEAYGVKVEE